MDAPEYDVIWSLDHASSVGRQERHFYFFLLFLLSRKFRNATTKPPKVQSKVNIPRKIEIISKAVIITHLPSYVFRQAGHLAREATTLSWVLFLRVSTQEYYIIFHRFHQYFSNISSCYQYIICHVCYAVMFLYIFKQYIKCLVLSTHKSNLICLSIQLFCIAS